MSYDQYIPAGALDQPHSNVVPLPRHEDHERVLTCQGCRQTILVCGFVDDLDPDSYVGVFCGCRQPLDPRALELRAVLDRAQAQAATAAETGDPIPY